MERRLTAILGADVYGYSRLMRGDEEAKLRTLSAYRKIIDQLFENHHGRLVNSAGASVLAEFTSVVEAVSPDRKRSRPPRFLNAGDDFKLTSWRHSSVVTPG